MPCTYWAIFTLLKTIAHTFIIMNKPKCFILFLAFFNSYINFGQNLTLRVNGETEKATATIDSVGYQNTFKDYLSLENEVFSLRNKLQKKGYIDSRIEEITNQNDSLFNAVLKIGKPVNNVRVYLPENFDKALLSYLDVTIDSSFFDLKINTLENTLNKLNKTLAEQGDPFSSLVLTDIERSGTDQLSGILKIKSNQKRRIDKIIIKGYEKFPKSFVKRFLKLKEGQSFNLEEIKEKTQQLSELRFANEIKSPEVLFTKDSTTLYIYTEKNKSNNFDGFLGFGTNENTNRIEFDGYLDLRLINNLNYGESIRLFYKSDEIDQQTIDIQANAPFLFSSPVGLDIGLNIFRKDSTFSTTTQRARINYQVNPNHRVALGIKGIVSSNLLENSTSILNDYNSSFYEVNYNYTKAQFYDPLFPINFYLDITSNFGNRTKNDVKLSQTAFNLEAFKIFNLNNRNSVFLRLTGASLASDDYLDNELYRFGGINSIRGFEENSLVANLFGVLNTEYRYKLSNSIYIHSVIDAAYFENDLTDTKNKLFGFGFGLGLLTNSGLFRLNYSSGKTENVPFRLSDSKIHVSLTATF